MTGRRDFIAGLAASPALLAQKNPNDKIGVAVVGVGTRGYYLLTEFQKVPNTEIRVICDLYDGNIRRAQQATTYKDVRVVKEWEKAVEASEVDAVVIATPDFWHAPMVIRAAQAKKDIYVEKGWCRTLDEAKKMRKAIKENGVAMQLGHNYNSLPTFHKAREIFQSGALGKTPLIRLYIDRTSAHPEWQFYTAYDQQEPPADASPETIDWQRFVANASRRPFDVDRFFTWRRWWEYGTGIAGDLMSHLWDSANMVAGLGIPEGIITHGGQYFWKDGRDVPDMWNVVMDYPKKEMAVTFGCTFHNRHVGEKEQFLGRDLTMEVSPGFLRTWEAEWKPEFRQKYRGGAAAVKPVYEFQRRELEVSSHWADFLDCVRTRQKPRCDVDRAFEEAAVIAMSVEAYKRERRVKWDPVREAIV
jgi:predicted dehydrogenase